MNSKYSFDSYKRDMDIIQQNINNVMKPLTYIFNSSYLSKLVESQWNKQQFERKWKTHNYPPILLLAQM